MGACWTSTTNWTQTRSRGCTAGSDRAVPWRSPPASPSSPPSKRALTKPTRTGKSTSSLPPFLKILAFDRIGVLFWQVNESLQNRFFTSVLENLLQPALRNKETAARATILQRRFHQAAVAAGGEAEGVGEPGRRLAALHNQLSASIPTSQLLVLRLNLPDPLLAQPQPADFKAWAASAEHDRLAPSTNPEKLNDTT